MRNCWNKLLAITVMSLTISLAGLVTSGPVFGVGSPDHPDPPDCMDNQNGTITDNKTHLMWQQETAARKRSWKEAMNYASTLSLGGHSDWRLPSKDELVGLYKSECKAMMHVVTHVHWSATSFAGDVAWHVNFSNGYVSNFYKSDQNYVLAVRWAR